MQAKRQHQVSVVVTGYGNGEVIVDAFFQFVVRGKPQGGRQVDFCLLYRVEIRFDGVDSHEPPLIRTSSGDDMPI